jgi:hypothetical protein
MAVEQTISEDSNAGIVTIGVCQIPGWIDDIACDSCGSRRICHEDYDAYFCPSCDAWLESTCSDKACSYCSQRPDRPLPS